MEWIPVEDRFSFWKEDASKHLVETESYSLEDFPGGVAYVGSEWTVAEIAIAIVVLEVSH